MAAFDSFGPIPTNSPSPVSSDSFPEHDNDLLINGDEFGDESQNIGGKRKSRRPPSTAERRATHNAVERARRESLNGRFMELATVLPNMANVKRPSKSAIVAKSLEFVHGAQVREQFLSNQNDVLRSEVNELRARLGIAPLVGSPAAAAVAVPLPAVHPRKASSVASSASSVHDSPLTTHGFLENSPIAPSGFSYNPAFAGTFPAQHTQPEKVPPTPTPTTTSFAPRETPAPLDVNYLMALSLQQQQQQQSLFGMHHHPQQQQQQHNAGPMSSYSAVAPWLMPPTGPAPLMAGGDAQWLFH